MRALSLAVLLILSSCKTYIIAEKVKYVVSLNIHRSWDGEQNYVPSDNCAWFNYNDACGSIFKAKVGQDFTIFADIEAVDKLGVEYVVEPPTPPAYAEVPNEDVPITVVDAVTGEPAPADTVYDFLFDGDGSPRMYLNSATTIRLGEEQNFYLAFSRPGLWRFKLTYSDGNAQDYVYGPIMKISPP